MRLTLVWSRPAVSTSTSSTPRDRRGLHRVEHDRARVGTLLTADELHAEAVGPEPELLGRGGAERVGGRQQHTMALGLLAAGELGDGRRLADAVDTDEQPHVRSHPARAGAPAVPRRCRRAARRSRREQLGQLAASSRARRLPRAPDAFEEPLRRRHADVGEEQRLLELVPRLVVDRAAARNSPDEPAERGRGSARADRAGAAISTVSGSARRRLGRWCFRPGWRRRCLDLGRGRWPRWRLELPRPHPGRPGAPGTRGTSTSSRASRKIATTTMTAVVPDM